MKNPESLVDLVTSSQAGDANALEDLLFWAHTPVSFLCNKILKDDNTAKAQTREILYMISRKIQTLKDPKLFQKWVARLTIAKCMQVLPDTRWMEDVLEEKELPIAGQSLDQERTVDAVARMVDMLPEKPRVCITLLCCGDLHSNDIAKATGYSVDAVHRYMAEAQTFVVEQIEAYQQKGTELYPIDSLKEVLQAAMFQSGDSDDALPLVYGALGKEIPVPVDPDRGRRILLWVGIGVLTALILALCGLNLWIRSRNTYSPKDYTPATVTVPTEATEPEETEPEQTEETVPETEETEPTVENTEPQPEKEEKAREETKPKATEPVSKPQASGKPAASNPDREVPSDAPQTGEDGHTHRYLTTKSSINCETGGTRRYECADCDYYYTEEIAPTGSHNLITVPGNGPEYSATCTKPGKQNQICTKCNFISRVEDPNAPALGHSYSDTVVPPTETEQGYTLHKCSRCSDSYKDNFVPATGAASQETQQAPAENPDGENPA